MLSALASGAPTIRRYELCKAACDSLGSGFYFEYVLNGKSMSCSRASCTEMSDYSDGLHIAVVGHLEIDIRVRSLWHSRLHALNDAVEDLRCCVHRTMPRFANPDRAGKMRTGSALASRPTKVCHNTKYCDHIFALQWHLASINFEWQPLWNKQHRAFPYSSEQLSQADFGIL